MSDLVTADNLLSILDSPITLALTAPMVINDRVLIGFALSPEESYCADLSLDEFRFLCPSLYLRVNSKRIFHGLKRIWEFLDSRGLLPDAHDDNGTDINKIDDAKLMAYLLDPDSGRELEFGEYRVQEGLTLANLTARYLGDRYPYRNTDIYEKGSHEALAGILAHDATVIYWLAAELPGRMSKDRHKLYRQLELPLEGFRSRWRLTSSERGPRPEGSSVHTCVQLRLRASSNTRPHSIHTATWRHCSRLGGA